MAKGYTEFELSELAWSRFTATTPTETWSLPMNNNKINMMDTVLTYITVSLQ